MTAPLTPFEAFELAVSRAGSESEFARIVGCTPGNINQLLKKRSQLSHRFVLKAEEATGVSRHDLRPDIYPVEAPSLVREATLRFPPTLSQRDDVGRNSSS